MNPIDVAVDRLCLACGLCCNGVLFRDVELQRGDVPAKLEKLGLSLQALGRKTRFPQPCSALCCDNRCRIYSDRPTRCREFECALLKEVATGSLEATTALRTIQQARKGADHVKNLLRKLGDADEHVPLSLRFQRLTKRLERSLPDDSAAETFSHLTLAVHDLNLLLREAFHPGNG